MSYAGAPHQEAYEPQGQNSMTIDEMRILHRTALAEAESKRTELRLVLASRYRELVGSSDEVISMKERAEELNALVIALPELVERVVQSADASEAGGSTGGSEKLTPDESSSKLEGTGEKSSLVAVRCELSRLPREIHRCLDEKNVHGAAAALISLFEVIASRSKSYPLANLLSGSKQIPDNITNSPLLETQMRMVYLHVQTLPTRVQKLARRVLLQSAAKHGGARGTAAALSALDLLDLGSQKNAAPSSGPSPYAASRSTKLIDLYYESKAQLLNKLLNRLTLPTSVSAADATSVTNAAEFILSKIVLILQYDVILHPYQIFVQRNFPVTDANESDATEETKTMDKKIVDEIMSTMPRFDSDLLKSKASRFLAAHLPLIRTKVKSVLMIIAGTTASKLGQIRQSLYDKTDGVECMNALDSSGIYTWDEAVSGMVDIRVVSHGTSFAPAADSGKGTIGGDQGIAASNGHNGQQGSSRRFSLWGALFSNTFSSLVHSLLTTSFHSVHARVVSTLRTSLARAPPFEYMLPHEAHRNALRIATDLDASLRKVSDDAHELLVHAEEREESERRLRQSLYVQTCEIMGRLLNELRRMLLVKQKEEDAIKELIVGRLCHLLKFRLSSLPNLLDPKSSPAVLAGLGGGKSTGMISLMELSSSFDLADDDDDGLISIEEAMEAMESAFSGTHFHGAEMVRDTLLLSTSQSGAGDTASDVTKTNGSFAPNKHSSAPQNVTLSELALLSAKGLRHDASGPQSALGTVQSSLDEIVTRCFKGWARAALSPPLKSFRTKLRESVEVSSTVSDIEWRRLNGLIEKEDDDLLKEIHDSTTINDGLTQRQKIVLGHVSPHFLSYLLAVAAVLNRSICPADSLPPVPSVDYAKALGICFSEEEEETVNMMVTIRGSLLGEALLSLSQSLKEEICDSCGDADESEILKKCSPSSLIQLLMDVRFVNRCFFERNQNGFLSTSDFIDDSRGFMTLLSQRLSDSVKAAVEDGLSIDRAISERHSQVFVSCGLFLSSIFGEDDHDEHTLIDSVSNGVGGTSLLLSSSLVTNPLSSSRRFTLLPIQAEKSLTELQLRGRYGKKVREEKENNKDVSSGNALGSGFGFLSSMLSTKTR